MADQTIDGTLTVTGSVLLGTNGSSALNARDADANAQNLLYIDAWDSVVRGPMHSRKHRYISYIPSGTEHRELLWHGWNGAFAPGVKETPIGGGYLIAFTPEGGSEIATGAVAGDGVRLDFGKLQTKTNRRTSLWGMFNTLQNDQIDLQFGFIGLPPVSGNPAQLRLRYVSGASAALWTAYSNDGAGHESTSTFTGRDDATFRRQFSISWENNYGGNPADVYFNVANANNQFDLELTHTFAMGSLPSVDVPLFPYLQFRTNANAARTFMLDHVWGWFER